MIPVNRTYAPIQALVDEFVRCGMRDAVTSPGSRNAPIALTLAGDRRLRTVSVLDERSAGFLALGLAKSSGRPVAITCTSGTAAANLLPAIAEADEARVPLIVLSADRPPELREVGAGQSIDQIGIYGSAVRWFVEVGNHEPSRASAVHHRALACRAHATALGPPPGPVHLNLGLREPLDPTPAPLDPEPWEGREDGRPWVTVDRDLAPSARMVERTAESLMRASRGVIVCGPTRERDLAGPVGALAAELGWPVLAEPTSGVRAGSHDRSHVIAHYDALLRSEAFAARHAPDLVLRFGDTPTSKPLRAWLGRALQTVVDPDAVWHEPTRAADTVVVAEGSALAGALAERLGGAPAAAEEWLESWRAADALVGPALDAAPDPFEPKVYAALADALPDETTVWISSSMPIRDVETFFPSSPRRLRFLANRGANGIDGVVSAAAGAALDAGGRAVLLTGELALLHDLGGLASAKRAGVELTVVSVANGGGGIFDFLPLAGSADPALYERHVATPVDVEIERVAALVGWRHTLASTPEEVAAAVAEPGLVEVRTDRARNVELHREVLGRVAHELEAVPAR